MEFYAPVREVFRKQAPKTWWPQAKKNLVGNRFGFKLSPKTKKELGNISAPVFGDNQFETNRQVPCQEPRFRNSGSRRARPAAKVAYALVYEGVEAVRKIPRSSRTDHHSQSAARGHSPRGRQTIMINAAHASDSEESDQREFGM